MAPADKFFMKRSRFYPWGHIVTKPLEYKENELIDRMNKLAIEIEKDKKANPERYSQIYVPIEIKAKMERAKKKLIGDLSAWWFGEHK